jgi:hypothetical protein
MFSTIDCINNNLACFEDGFGDSGSFLNVGGHHFYVAVTKPFPKEVTDVSDPLCDTSSSCSESNDLGAMVKVLALGARKAVTHHAPRARRSNAFFHRRKLLRSQHRTPWMSPLWTCTHHSTMPSTPSRPPRLWSRRASHSSTKRPTSKTLNIA